MTAPRRVPTADSQTLASYREPARPAEPREPRTVITYEEPWGLVHLFLWGWCLFWDVWVAAFLVVEPWNPLILLCHLPIGLVITYYVFRWTWSRFRLEIGPGRLECFDSGSRTHDVARAHIDGLLVTQRLYENEGPCAEWIISMRLGSLTTESVFSRHAGGGDAQPAVVDQLVALLAHELACPVARESRDERKR